MRKGFKKFTAILMAALMLLAVFPASAWGTEEYSNSVFPGIGLASILPDDTPVATYIFYCNGTEYARQSVKNGEPLYEPETPTAAAGTVFTGWYTAADGGDKFDSFGQLFVSTKTEINLYARFANAYYIYFYTPDGLTLKHTLAVADNTSSANVSSVTYDAGGTKKVTGWANTPNGKSDVSANVTFPAGATSVSLYAIETEGYFVVFQTGDGTSMEPAFKEAGQTLVLNTVGEPARMGYRFDGWYENEECTGNAVDSVSSAKTLYAKWIPAQTDLTVVFWYENANDANYSYVDSKTLKVDTGKMVNSDTYKDEAFTGRDDTHFAYNSAKAETVTVAGDGTTKLNVYFTRNTYSMNLKLKYNYMWISPDGQTYEIRSNTVDVKTITAKYEQNISSHFPVYFDDYPDLTNDPHLKNYKGKGYALTWKVKEEGSQIYWLTDVNMMPGEDVTYYTYSVISNEYNCYYYLEAVNGVTTTGETKSFDGKTFVLYKKVPIPGTISTVVDGEMKIVPSKLSYAEEFHDIAGFTQYKSDPVFESTASQPDVKQENLFYYTRNSYLLEFFNYNAKLENKKTSVQYEAPLQGYVKNFTPPYPAGVEESVLTFEGWYTDQYFKNEVTENTRMPNGDMLLYAKWVPMKHTVSFNLGYDGATGTPEPQSVTARNKAKQPNDPVRAGFKFLGWYVGDEPFSFDTLILKDTVLTAKWLSESTFQVAYDANGGSGQVPTDDTKYADGAKAAIANKGELMPPAPTEDNPEEKVFLGWATRADATNADYQPGDAMEIKADNAAAGVITLYAVWGPKPNTTKLTYNANYIAEGASSADTVQHTENGSSELVNNATVALYPDSTFNRSGYQLIGWSKTPGEENEKDYDCVESVIVDNLGEDENILYAVWKRTTVDVTITKQVTGNMGDRSKSFNFTVNSSVAMGSGEGYTLSDDAMTATFTLSHDHSMTLKDVPIGATLEVIEKAMGYESSMTFNGAAVDGKSVTVQKGNNEIVVTNNLVATPDTGVLLDSLPYILILAVVVAIGVIVFIRKRRNRDDD